MEITQEQKEQQLKECIHMMNVYRGDNKPPIPKNSELLLRTASIFVKSVNKSNQGEVI